MSNIYSNVFFFYLFAFPYHSVFGNTYFLIAKQISHQFQLELKWTTLIFYIALKNRYSDAMQTAFMFQCIASYAHNGSVVHCKCSCIYTDMKFVINYSNINLTNTERLKRQSRQSSDEF